MRNFKTGLMTIHFQEEQLYDVHDTIGNVTVNVLLFGIWHPGV